MTDSSRPILVLAPHLRWPVRNGADLTQDGLGCALSHHVPFVDVVGEHEVVRFENGLCVQRRSFDNRIRSRRAAALRTLLKRSHYYAERFNTPSFVREARTQLANPDYSVVLHSYLTTAAVARLHAGKHATPSHRHFVWTHNDEFAWFDDQARAARNPLARLVAVFSGRWLRRFAARNADALTLLHVTEDDFAGWNRHVPSHHGAVVPIGAKLPAAAAPPLPAGAPLRLLFVGALGVKMNLDALEHYAKHFEPVLRTRFGADLPVDVVGSSPLPAVEALCAERGWTLHPNVSDAELDGLLAHATSTLLPFAYATGAKLKLLTSLASGVPFLGTEAVQAQADLAAPPSLLSDDPERWAARLALLRSTGIDAEHRARLRVVAEAHSWDASAQRILNLL